MPSPRPPLLALCLCLPGLALAQESDPRLDIQHFDPSPQSATFTRLRDAEQAKGGVFAAFAALNYGWRPFEIGDPDSGVRQIGITDHLFGVDLGAEYAVHDRLAIGVSVPVLQVSGMPENGQRLAEAIGGSGKKVGLGDMVVQFGIAPLRQDAGQPFNVAFVPRFVLPTGTRKQFLGTGTVGLGADVAGGYRWDPVRFSAMVGYQFVPVSDTTLGLYSDDVVRYGVGVGIATSVDDLEFEVEWAGSTAVAAAGKQALGDDWKAATHSPMEIGVGAVWAPKPVWLKIGAAAGLTRGYGTPVMRAFVQGGFTTAKDGSSDRDFDGIVDRLDQCRDDPEDMDGWQDEDGCPDPDNDGDGILDAVDGPVPEQRFDTWAPGDLVQGACANSPEDFDGFEDEDGCPDDDNDGDGIPDALDGPRDADGNVVEWKEGYPGIGACADHAEVVNGVLDDDGCPDTSKARLDWRINEIVVLETIYFKFDKWELDPASYGVMEAVQAVLVAYPSIAKVEIQGHTDERGSATYNEGLSQKRVESVKAWLVAAGIADERIVAKGYGESAPIVPGATTEEDHQKNRRVQFVIVERTSTAPPVVPAPATPPAP